MSTVFQDLVYFLNQVSFIERVQTFHFMPNDFTCNMSDLAKFAFTLYSETSIPRQEVKSKNRQDEGSIKQDHDISAQTVIRVKD